MAVRTMIEAIREGLADEMRRDGTVIVQGTFVQGNIVFGGPVVLP